MARSRSETRRCTWPTRGECFADMITVLCA
ncbi:preprotein translocase subunit SecE [Loktanella sp. Alg231-35]